MISSQKCLKFINSMTPILFDSRLTPDGSQIIAYLDSFRNTIEVCSFGFNMWQKLDAKNVASIALPPDCRHEDIQSILLVTEETQSSSFLNQSLSSAQGISTIHGSDMKNLKAKNQPFVVLVDQVRGISVYSIDEDYQESALVQSMAWIEFASTNPFELRVEDKTSFHSIRVLGYVTGSTTSSGLPSGYLLLIDNDEYLVKLISLQHKRVHRSVEFLNVLSFQQVDPTKLVMVVKNYQTQNEAEPSHSVVMWNIAGPTTSDQLVSIVPLPA